MALIGEEWKVKDVCMFKQRKRGMCVCVCAFACVCVSGKNTLEKLGQKRIYFFLENERKLFLFYNFYRQSLLRLLQNF